MYFVYNDAARLVHWQIIFEEPNNVGCPEQTFSTSPFVPFPCRRGAAF